MKKIFLLFVVALLVGCHSNENPNGPDSPNTVASVPNNEIWYTSVDNTIIKPVSTTYFGSNIISNTYKNGKGVIKFDGDITKIGEHAFNTQIEDDEIENKLKSITIPNSITSIGIGAFYNCRYLEGFYGKFASADCRCLIIDGQLIAFASAGLTNYTIPSGVASIREYTFDYSMSIVSITLPKSVTSIEKGAFDFCDHLTTIYCMPTVPPETHSPFSSDKIVARQIYVPRESVEAYKAAEGWSDYASDIVGYDF